MWYFQRQKGIKKSDYWCLKVRTESPLALYKRNQHSLLICDNRHFFFIWIFLFFFPSIWGRGWRQRDFLDGKRWCVNAHWLYTDDSQFREGISQHNSLKRWWDHGSIVWCVPGMRFDNLLWKFMKKKLSADLGFPALEFPLQFTWTSITLRYLCNAFCLMLLTVTVHVTTE